MKAPFWSKQTLFFFQIYFHTGSTQINGCPWTWEENKTWQKEEKNKAGCKFVERCWCQLKQPRCYAYSMLSNHTLRSFCRHRVVFSDHQRLILFRLKKKKSISIHFSIQIHFAKFSLPSYLQCLARCQRVWWFVVGVVNQMQLVTEIMNYNMMFCLPVNSSVH